MENEKKKGKPRGRSGGRPQSRPKEGPKSYKIAFRTWEPIYMRLQESAWAASRSLSDEVGYRLVQTLNDESLLNSVAWRDRGATQDLIRLILSAISMVEMHLADAATAAVKLDLKHWNEDPKRARELFETLLALQYTILIDGIRPLEGEDDYARELRAITDEVGKVDDVTLIGSRAEFTARFVLLNAGYKSIPLVIDGNEAAAKAKYDRLIKEYDHLIWLIRTRPKYGMDFLELKAKKVLEQIGRLPYPEPHDVEGEHKGQSAEDKVINAMVDVLTFADFVDGDRSRSGHDEKFLRERATRLIARLNDILDEADRTRGARSRSIGA